MRGDYRGRQVGSERLVMPDARPSPPAAAHRAWSGRRRSVRYKRGAAGSNPFAPTRAEQQKRFLTSGNAVGYRLWFSGWLIASGRLLPPSAVETEPPPRPTLATGIGSTVCSARGNSWSARHGKAADSQQILMEDDHGSARKVFGDLVKVGENDRCLLRGAASDQAADEDHRRIASP